MTLVLVSTEISCPRCLNPTFEVEMTEDPLFRHGGYGEARFTRTRICDACGHFFIAEQRSLRPRPVASLG